ncbi:MFS transporter [Ralstonia sp. A12]|uniref:MFS transporter n=1 Tax=Ralstonia sp. A12 TaxID=1217052 RepID=UPI000574C893|nr:MFS transporter [Ralstonia sp. A12]KHK57937.1 MFS transporter [Ralstonia sp. A12]
MTTAALSPAAPAHVSHHHRWKVLGVGVAANASFSAAFSGIPTTAVFIRSSYHLGNAELGIALGLLGLGIAISELPWGLLTDRWGDRTVLLAGLGATALALFVMACFVAPMHGSVPPLAWLAAGMLSVGLLGGSVNGSSGRAVMGWFREGERGLAMSIRQTAVPLGGGIGALVLPSLAAHAGFAVVYGVLAAACALTAVLTWLWVHEAPDVVTTIAKTEATAGPGPLRDPVLWRMALSIGLLCVPQGAVVAFATVFLRDFAHANVLTLSLTMAAVQGGAAVMRVWSGRWTDRHGNRRAYLLTCARLSAALFVVLAGVAWMTTALPIDLSIMRAALVVAIVVAGICVSAWHGVGFTEMATLAGVQRAGTALGLGNTGAFSALGLTSLFLPHVLAWSSWPVVWLVTAGCALIAWRVLPAVHR